MTTPDPVPLFTCGCVVVGPARFTKADGSPVETPAGHWEIRLCAAHMRGAASVPGPVTADDLDDLRHMLGATSDRRRSSWGFRNYFVGDAPSMARLVAAGFARKIRAGGEMTGGDPVYAATPEGCRAAGMTAREIARMEPPPEAAGKGGA